MTTGITARSYEAALKDVRKAVEQEGDASGWLRGADLSRDGPLAAEAWVFDTAYTHVLLVRHRWRGWVPPGGVVEADETPHEAAIRETREETGLAVRLEAVPAMASVRSFREDWHAVANLAYAGQADRRAQLEPEEGQSAAWHALDEPWEGWFAGDRARMRAYAAARVRDSIRS